MEQASTIDVGLGKQVFQVHGVCQGGEVLTAQEAPSPHAFRQRDLPWRRPDGGGGRTA